MQPFEYMVLRDIAPWTRPRATVQNTTRFAYYLLSLLVRIWCGFLLIRAESEVESLDPVNPPSQSNYHSQSRYQIQSRFHNQVILLLLRHRRAGFPTLPQASGNLGDLILRSPYHAIQRIPSTRWIRDMAQMSRSLNTILRVGWQLAVLTSARTTRPSVSPQFPSRKFTWKTKDHRADCSQRITTHIPGVDPPASSDA
jgi:hypothetical protein